MVERLVAELRRCPQLTRIVLTRNIPESSALRDDGFVEVVENAAPQGFGANHNAAFGRCREPFFCVLNPDIELPANPFPALLQALDADVVALAAPLILTPDGAIEDSVRRFPTLTSLLRKALGGADGRYPITAGAAPFCVDWVAGMFMLFRAAAFTRLGGFDAAYFLYYEDVDICQRARRAGMQVAVCPSVSAVHDARRDSHRNLRHLRWHLSSMLRYLVGSRR